MMLALAQRNGVALPYADINEVRSAYAFSNLQDFLDLYYAGMAVLQTPQDYYDLTQAYLDRARADGVRHCEIFFDPQGHTERGVELAVVMEGIKGAITDAADLTAYLIPNVLRHLPEVNALAMYEDLAPFRDEFVGLGLDSSEVGHPPSKFQTVFARARADGLKCVAHAGEEGPPEYVWEALQLLQVDRIDHGNRALEDAELVTKLARDGTALTVCPLSNLKLCVVDTLANHPVRAMLDAGLNATLNSDDPAYFGGYINDNILQVAQAAPLSDNDIITLLGNSISASFLPDADKTALLDALSTSASL